MTVNEKSRPGQGGRFILAHDSDIVPTDCLACFGNSGRDSLVFKHNDAYPDFGPLCITCYAILTSPHRRRNRLDGKCVTCGSGHVKTVGTGAAQLCLPCLEDLTKVIDWCTP